MTTQSALFICGGPCHLSSWSFPLVHLWKKNTSGFLFQSFIVISESEEQKHGSVWKVLLTEAPGDGQKSSAGRSGLLTLKTGGNMNWTTERVWTRQEVIIRKWDKRGWKVWRAVRVLTVTTRNHLCSFNQTYRTSADVCLTAFCPSEPTWPPL